MPSTTSERPIFFNEPGIVVGAKAVYATCGRLVTNGSARYTWDDMTPAGYMAKRVKTPVGFHADGVVDVYSLSDCVNDDFADYVQYWKHNGYWLFDSPEIIQAVAQDNHIQLEGTSLFYYEVYEKEFDGKIWLPHQPEMSFPTNILAPSEKTLEGFDVVTFFAHSTPECSPLSCNGMAGEIHTNEHCLLDSFENAYEKVSAGAFSQAEPGPYRIFAVYSVPWRTYGQTGHAAEVSLRPTTSL